MDWNQALRLAQGADIPHAPMDETAPEAPTLAKILQYSRLPAIARSAQGINPNQPNTTTIPKTNPLPPWITNFTPGPVQR